MREVAHAYIDRGWAVLLLSTDSSGGKIPPRNCHECQWKSPTYVKHSGADCDHLLCHGVYSATHDKIRFGKMLEKLPHGQLAIRTGQASRLLVIDAEAHSKKEGEPTGLDVLDNWQTWVQSDWGLPETLSSRSVSGGIHLYYRIPVGVEIGSGRILPNVDVKAEYGYVGAVSGQTSRAWIDSTTPVADAPAELLQWLQTAKRMGTTGGSGGGSRPDGYDFHAFLKDGCPDGHRDYFFNDLAFRLRKKNTPRDIYEQQVWEAWQACEQPPLAIYEMPWEHVQYKLERVWSTVEPDPPNPGISWAINAMESAARRLAGGLAGGSAGGSTSGSVGGNGDVGSGGTGSIELPPIVIGDLDPEHWYGTHDDGTAQRLMDVWGDWFRAIPRQRGGHAWIHFNGITWEQDTHELIWSGIGHVVSLLPQELSHWERRCAELQAEGVTDWRTTLVGGNGQNADQFQIIVALRRYVSACRENARKQTGVTAFARRREIAIAEEDLDAETRYLALLDGRVLDVEAVHVNKPRNEWLLPARPEMLLTKELGCGYVAPDTDKPGTLYEFSNFRRYLEDVLPHKTVRDTLQEIVGYALLGRPTEKIIVLLHGPPDSGKTVLLEVLEALFGGYGGWTDGQALIAGKAKSPHSEWLNNIRGLRLVVTPETAKGAKIDAAWMKSYTGREPQTSRGAYGDRTVTWTPTGIIINASNHYLEYDAEDTAVAERTQVIEFEQQFLRGDPRRDDQLPQKIKDRELPIVLNWALEGLRRHGARTDESGQRAPKLKIADKIVEWSKRYRVAQDHVGQFITDALEECKLEEVECTDTTSVSGFVPAKVVYTLYKTWCRAQEMRKPLGRNTFNSHLKRVYHWKDADSGGKRWLGYTSKITDELSAELTRW